LELELPGDAIVDQLLAGDDVDQMLAGGDVGQLAGGDDVVVHDSVEQQDAEVQRSAAAVEQLPAQTEVEHKGEDVVVLTNVQRFVVNKPSKELWQK
jgi:hypothetical protein